MLKKFELIYKVTCFTVLSQYTHGFLDSRFVFFFNLIKNNIKKQNYFENLEKVYVLFILFKI